MGMIATTKYGDTIVLTTTAERQLNEKRAKLETVLPRRYGDNNANQN